MIQTLSIYSDSCTDPYANIAREEFLTFDVKPGECILYLWQNAHTVVTGRNQNCWKECRVTELEASGGRLARRLSGGGAVYHDLGNLNFTFCLRKEEADVTRQTAVIRGAAASFGLSAVQTGRNDVVIDGRKFSGNAFYDSRGCYYHHGTLMIDVNQETLQACLRPSAAKLKSKGVNSVRSRVVNLSALNPDINTDTMKQAMIAAASRVYRVPAQKYDSSRFDEAGILRRTDFFSSSEWKYGRRIPFSNTLSHRFAWGEAELAFRADRGCIEEARLSSDAMNADWFKDIGSQFTGLPYEAEAVCRVLDGILTARRVPEDVREDLKSMVRNEL